MALLQVGRYPHVIDDLIGNVTPNQTLVGLGVILFITLLFIRFGRTILTQLLYAMQLVLRPFRTLEHVPRLHGGIRIFLF